ncbi:Vesicle transport protein GOT1B [Chionoecetes opilio]|uniref:Vesicle transport protein GOT1B n=1 Tax=Chionoecetes opilio TaxID=41210 RepID=A0A8J4YFS7_CHIOP|nr:Vesicle transport protein GOT1B [Chionoecetes opilio]
MISITDTQKIGVGFVAFGVSFIFLGVILLFDKGLLAIGNILFLAGLAFVAGLDRSFRFFFQRHKWKGSGAFFGGILMVLVGWPLIGMCIEVYGFIVLFSGFFPVAINFLRRVPVLGTFLNLPFIGGVSQRGGTALCGHSLSLTS